MKLEAGYLECPRSSERMPIKSGPVRESIREINDNSWLVGDRILLSRISNRFPSSGPTWSDGKGSFYAVSDAPRPLPPSRPLSATANIQMVYDAGGVSAVWRIGEAFCKVKDLNMNSTREHVTLQYLHKKRPLSFAIPDVYYHVEDDSRYYIILSSLTGQTVAEVWSDLDEVAKKHYVSQVSSICKELAVWQANTISGVDGRHLSDEFLTLSGLQKDFSPQKLLSNCKALEMDCSTFVFYHCDLGPGNIIVNLENGSIGIIDWETAGFVPKEWIRTKFCISGGMDLPYGDQESKYDWRKRVLRQLGEEGFPEIANRWSTWHNNED